MKKPATAPLSPGLTAMRDVMTFIEKEGIEAIRAIRVLLAIIERPGLSVREYSKTLSLTPPAITRHCSNLVDQGWIDRQTDHSDRRLVVLTPTRMGKWVATRMDHTICTETGASTEHLAKTSLVRPVLRQAAA